MDISGIHDSGHRFTNNLTTNRNRISELLTLSNVYDMRKIIFEMGPRTYMPLTVVPY